MLTDSRIERLLVVGKEINDLIFKINTATNYLARNGTATDFEPVEIARSQLARDLSGDYAEAKSLLPVLDEVILKLEGQRRELQNVHMMNVGLARIEGLTGTTKHEQFVQVAASTQARVMEVENLIKALDALAKDLGNPRKAPHLCPRCSSGRVSYRVTPSDLGFTLYKCDECGNAWRITEFSMHLE